MKQCIRVEIRRVLYSPWFYVSLTVSFLLAITQIYQMYKPIYLDYYEYPLSVFNCWLGGEPVSFASRYLKVLFPILVVLPYSHTLFTDKKSGYIRNVCTRKEKKIYVSSKYFVSLCVGFFIGLFPYLLNLLIAMAIYPMLLPEPLTSTFMVGPESFMGNIFHSHPMVYTITYLFIYSFYCGVLATASLGIGTFASNRFVVTFAPVISFFAFGNIMHVLQFQQLNPITAFDPSQPARTNGISLLILFAIPLVFSIFTMIREANNETY